MTDNEVDGTLLLVVAHPDDETFGCGSLLMAAADAGLTTVVLSATRGEAGEAQDGTPPTELGAVREAETRAAAAALGVSGVMFLDYSDSGMGGPADPGTLAGAEVTEVADDVRTVIDDVRPTVVVTLDGSDGHRDHQRIREATLAAVDAATHQVDTVFLHCLPQALMQLWVEHMVATDPSWEHLLQDVPGTPDSDITTVLDTTALLPRRESAILLHRSQRSPFDGLPEDLYRAFLTAEHLTRIRPVWTGGPRETTWRHPAARHTRSQESS